MLTDSTKPIIKVAGLGKQYRIQGPQAAYGTLRESLTGLMRKPLDRLRRGKVSERRMFWALRDVNLEIKQGEVVGIIGRNGAGKSTLLKILSRITEPTLGRVELYGRVGSLLEVGTGFHPELTGRENIYLNGAILGMNRAEINSKFDEIVAFAEIDEFLDTPVKRYSSGMHMRLAFAVAAHLEPEILLVDEVLAVGDASFQKKCLGKMTEVAEQGRTVLFVSHNMTAINQLCPRTILLSEGQVARSGRTAEVVPAYLQMGGGGNGGEWVWQDPLRAPGNEKVRLHAIRVISEGGIRSEVNIDQEVTIEVEFWNYQTGARNLCVNIYLLDGMGTIVLSTGNTPGANSLPETWFQKQHPAGLFRARCTLPANFLNEGQYHVTVYVVTLGPLVIEVDAPLAISFNVFDTGVMRTPGGGMGRWAGVVRVRLPWETDLVRLIDEQVLSEVAP
jgi:lipopolysaccharide transport system ATP-binding protein